MGGPLKADGRTPYRDPGLPRVNPPEPPPTPTQVVIRIALHVDGVPVESTDVEVPLGRIEDPGRLTEHVETRTGTIACRMVARVARATDVLRDAVHQARNLGSVSSPKCRQVVVDLIEEAVEIMDPDEGS